MKILVGIDYNLLTGEETKHYEEVSEESVKKVLEQLRDIHN